MNAKLRKFVTISLTTALILGIPYALFIAALVVWNGPLYEQLAHAGGITLLYMGICITFAGLIVYD